ncbi:zinc finger protein 804B [Trichosurus vulpecula]|uniref:zinc finger protein 804B n=1 Tax=Trichosurus vulpecula TaxID=9337 RepID=UPI00186B13E3|nr:zinc finger protein 804B [Trichosurus vulpecula]
MACYLVISSRHLRNGHYRGIKGVFRGPLCKNGSPSPDDAEKEKATAKALEDVKANFYCELCDKQYHKHQEFDNHINSYDHAHKQRLKELKQREFARNVASKSWKDEKKQEKALKRLHQLAELRQQSECVSGSGPVFKAPRVAPEKQFQQEVIPFKDARNAGYVKSSVLLKGKNIPRSISSKQRQVTQNQRLFQAERHYLFGSRVLQPLSDGSNPCHRTGVSFSFSKKAHLKLESSASVFNENTEETCECAKSPTRKTKQATASWKGCTFADGDMTLTGGKVINNPRGHIEKMISNTVPIRTKVLKDKNDTNDRILQDAINIHSSMSKSHIHLSGIDFNSSFREKEHGKEMNEIEDSPKGHSYHLYQTNTFCTPQNTYKHSEYRLFECLDELPSPTGQEHSIKLNPSSRMDNRIKSIEEAGTAKRNVDTFVKDTLIHGEESKALPFLHVLSKDGTTNLQWPTELLLFTKTKPCLSYGCNPLYFDFKHSRNTKGGNKQNEENAECCMEPSGTKTEKESQASGLIKDKRIVIQEDNQSLKPKKMKCNLDEKCSLKKYQSGLNNFEPKVNEQEYSTNDLSEKNPKVPAYLDASKKDCTVERHPCETESMGPLKDHLQGCQRVTLNNASEVKCFSPYVSRTKKHKSATWDTHLRYKCGSQDPWTFSSSLAECISDASDGGKDFHGIMSENHLQAFREASECKRNGSSDRCWRSSSPKSSLDRQSSSSDISLYSTSSHRSTCSSHKSSENGRDSLLYVCRKECHAKEGHKEWSRKHNFPHCSNDDEMSSHFPSKSQREGNCKLWSGFRNEKQPKYRYTHNRDKSRQGKTRNLCLAPKAGIPLGDPSTQSCLHSRHSRSSDRSPENLGIWDRNSGSFLREKTDYPNKGAAIQEDVENPHGSNLGKVNFVQYTSELIKWPQKDRDSGISRISGLPILERDKTSLPALRLLDGKHPEKCQEQTDKGEVFSDGCQMEVEDPSQSHFAIKLPAPVHSPPVFPLLEETQNISTVTKNKSSLIQRSAERDKDEGSQTKNDVALSDAGDENCLFKGIIQIGTDYRSPNIKMNTVPKEQVSPSISGTQPFIESSDPVANNFPGALPSIRHSAVVNSTETKEEQKILERHDVSMDMNEVEGSINSYFDSTMQKYGETEREVYHKSISPPLTQQPITFTPDEIDKYRLLQLQAQQHMQKQFLSKHLKATGPPAFSSTTGMPSVPVHQHTSITTIHHTLLQHFAVSASMNPHGGHLPIAHLHPLSQTHFTPISFSPLTPAVIPTHPTFLAGHPLHLVPTTHLHPPHIALQPLPHAAFIPTLFRPHLNPVAASIIHLNPLIQPVFQGQDFCHHSCSGQIQQFNRVKEVLNVSAHLN